MTDALRPRGIFGILRSRAPLPVILYLALRGFVPLRRRVGRASLVLLMPAAALLGVLALTLANFGIVIRMRAMVVVLLVPYAAVGLAVLAERRRARSYDAAPVRLTDVA